MELESTIRKLISSQTCLRKKGSKSREYMSGVRFHNADGRRGRFEESSASVAQTYQNLYVIRQNCRLLCDCAEIIYIMQAGAHQSYQVSNGHGDRGSHMCFVHPVSASYTGTQRQP